MGKRVVVSGYATMDYVVQVQGRFSGHGTMPMRTRTDADWPRPGGAVLYASRPLAAAGHAVFPVSWLGADRDGAMYRQVCAKAGLIPDGLAVTPDHPTARCLILYHADGSHGCLLQPGGGQVQPVQMGLLDGTDLLVLSAGPAAASLCLLDALPPAARLAWIVKPDPACFPPVLAEAIAARADWIFCNASERAWVEAVRRTAPSTQQLFRTLGANGVLVEGADGQTRLDAASLIAEDATGAGDSFAGGTLAGLLEGASPVEAARQGQAVARALLLSRLPGGVP